METHFDTFLRAIANCAKHERQGILGKDSLIYPPATDYGYDVTPPNSLTFGTMAVDGVHYAILTKDGQVQHDSAVIHVSPMDSDPCTVLSDSFVSYLAEACDVSIEEMEDVFQQEREGRSSLVAFLKSHFDQSRLFHKQTVTLDEYLDRAELADW